MTYRSHSVFRRGAAPLAIAAALAVSACHPANNVTSSDVMLAKAPGLPATLPLVAGPESTPSYAPAATRLPAAPQLGRVRVADSGADYAYADNAWSFGNAAFDGPPDYGFDYNGVEPWAWEGEDRSVTFVEPIDNGYRYYYYNSGADQPYYVRDPDYGYGYDNGRLAVIYGRNGSIIPNDQYGYRADYAARYQSRGLALFQASQARKRHAIVAANWAARSTAIFATQARLAADRARQGAWQHYHELVAPQAQAHWRSEQERRQAEAEHFANWRREGFRAAPPPRVIPVAWRQQKWAKNDLHYVTLVDQGAHHGTGIQSGTGGQRNAVILSTQKLQGTQPDAGRQQHKGTSGQSAGNRPFPGANGPLVQPASPQSYPAHEHGLLQRRLEGSAGTATQLQEKRAANVQQRKPQQGQARAAQAQGPALVGDQIQAERRRRQQVLDQGLAARGRTASRGHNDMPGQARGPSQTLSDAQRAQGQAVRGQAEHQAEAQAQSAREAKRSQMQAALGQMGGQARKQAAAAQGAQRARAHAAPPARAPQPAQPAPGNDNGSGHGGGKSRDHEHHRG